jgi:hypothetical protein
VLLLCILPIFHENRKKHILEVMAIDEYDDDDSFIDDEEEYAPGGTERTKTSGGGGGSGFAGISGTGTTAATKHGPPSASVVSSTSWMPFHMTTYWLDGQAHSYVKVTIVLPSGFAFRGLAGKINPTVGPDCKSLHIACDWPMPMYDTAYWEEGWQAERGYTDRDLLPMIQAAEREVSAIRRHLVIKKTTPIYSTAVIKLQVEVEKKVIRKVPFMDHVTGTQLLFLLLKVHKEDEEDQEDELDFRHHDSILIPPNPTSDRTKALRASLQQPPKRNSNAYKKLTINKRKKSVPVPESEEY